MSHKWQHIADLPEHWHSMASAELRSVALIWREQHDRLRKMDSIKKFNDRLAREWAIETGVIESVFSIERGVTVMLIEKGIEASLIPYGASDRPAEEVVAIVRDHQDALEGLFAFVKQNRVLSNSYIRELHAQMLKHQATTIGLDSLGNSVEIELKRGQFKSLPNNPSIPGIGLHEYCPPEHVQSEMDNLIAWHTQHLGSSVPVEIEAAWLHHRFTQIHPFQDGNGRIARAIASLVFIREGYFPLLITRDTRAEYIEALGIADNGDLLPLISLFAKLQKGSLLKALSLSEDVIRRSTTVNSVVDAAIGRLRQRREELITDQKRVLEIAKILEDEAVSTMEPLAQLLTAQLRQLDLNYRASVDRSEPRNDFWFKGQIVLVANKHNYFADTTTYKAWVRLRIVDERQTFLVISFHAIGTRFVGICGASAFVEFREIDESQQMAVEGPYPVSADLFEFSYLDDLEPLKGRFIQWLDQTLAMGLDQWRRQI